MDRRSALKTLAAAAASQVVGKAASPSPQIILYSQNLIQVEYPELGEVVKQLGFDGVDLTVMPGGHVEPRLANVDLVRAFEVMQGSGLSYPIITTALTSPMDRTAGPVLALSGMSRVAFFRPGYWAYGNAPNIMARVVEVQRDFAGLVNIGRQYGIAGAFHNLAGDHVGASIWDLQKILEPLDPAWAGFYFDPCQATAEGGVSGWEISLRLALPRLKAVTIQDFYWEKQDGKWQMVKCPLGQGMVDWPKFFRVLAQGNFTGPVTVDIAYPVKNMPSALSSELQFVRKQVQVAWPGPPKT